MRQAKGTADSSGCSVYLVALALLPPLAIHAFGGAGGEAMVAVGVVSYGFHAVLRAFVPLHQDGDFLQSFALSGLSLSLLLCGSYLLRPAYPMSATEGLLALALAWLAGAAVFTALAILLRGTSKEQPIDETWVSRLTSFVLSCVVLTTALWLAQGGEALLAGVIPDWSGLGEAFLLAALATAIATTGHRAQEQLRRASGRRSGLYGVISFIAALLLATVAAHIPSTELLGAGGAGLLFGLTAVLTLALMGGGGADFTACLLLMAVAVIGLPALTGTGGMAQLASLFLLLPILSASFLPLRDRGGKSDRMINHPTASVMASVQSRLGSFVLRLDFERKGVHFPFGGGEQFGAEPDLSLTEFFRLAPMRSVLDLMQRLQRGEAPVDVQIRFRLKKPTKDAEGRQEWVGQTFTLHVIENRYPSCWLVLERQTEIDDHMQNQSHSFDRLLSAAIVREERLLMLVAQDLATPTAALRDIALAAEEGRPWCELLPAFTLTLKVLADTLEDMRAGAGMADGLVAHGNFMLKRLAEQVETSFRVQAKREGVELLFSLPQQAEVMLRGDHGRVQVALARVLDNAFRHAQASEIRVAAFIAEAGGGDLTVSWHITDNGRGIDPRRRSELFEPLSAAGLRPGARPSLGLFAARKTMRMMGGDVTLNDDGTGTHFVVSHPVRLAPRDALPEDAVFAGEPDAQLLARRVLYLDPEESSDLPLPALLRIVGRVDRATSLADALASVLQSPPDLLILAPELGAGARMEAVKALLQTAVALPILIVVPQGEAADTAALQDPLIRVTEAPVSQLSLRRLAKELIASDPPEGDRRLDRAG